MTRPTSIAPRCAALALCFGSVVAAAATADEAPAPPPAPAAAAGAAAAPPPPPPGAAVERRVERRVVVIDHDGESEEYVTGEGGERRREIRIIREGAGPEGAMGPGRILMVPHGTDGPRMGGHRMRGGPGMRGERMMRMVRELGLTPEQRTQVRGLMEAAQPKMQELRGQIRAQDQKLRDADPNAKGYDAAVASSAKRVGELSAQLVQQRAQLRKQVWQVLTPEQRAKAEAKRAEAKKRRDAAADRMERRAREMRGTP